jgi:hypothetical protein
VRRDNAIASKNEESKKLLEETQLSLKRKRNNEVLDVLFEVEAKLHEEEMKLGQAEEDDRNNAFTK